LAATGETPPPVPQLVGACRGSVPTLVIRSQL
jgi:hypothetical protein